MTWWQAVLLGLVQGVTEFLPVSSSGHLVIFQEFFGINQPGVLFEIVVHLGTTVAIIVFFWKRLRSLFAKWSLLIVLATIPVGIVGLAVRSSIEALFSNLLVVGSALIITGVVNLRLDRLVKNKTKPAQVMTAKRAGLVGAAQAAAILPGISRSGLTTWMGIESGLSKKEAFEFAFIMAIPALLGTAVIQISDSFQSPFDFNLTALLLSFGAAMVSGLFSLKLFAWMLDTSSWQWFGWYCLALGSLVLLGSLVF